MTTRRTNNTIYETDIFICLESQSHTRSKRQTFYTFFIINQELCFLACVYMYFSCVGKKSQASTICKGKFIFSYINNIFIPELRKVVQYFMFKLSSKDHRNIFRNIYIMYCRKLSL